MTWLKAVDDYLEKMKEDHGDKLVGLGEAITENFQLGVSKTTQLASGAVEYVKNNPPSNIWKGEEER